MSVKRDLQSASAWESELNKERAGALSITARKLEDQLERCSKLREEMSLAEGLLHELLLQDYREARDESERQHWNLCVQREALGIRRHDDIDHFYPVAPKL